MVRMSAALAKVPSGNGGRPGSAFQPHGESLPDFSHALSTLDEPHLPVLSADCLDETLK